RRLGRPPQSKNDSPLGGADLLDRCPWDDRHCSAANEEDRLLSQQQGRPAKRLKLAPENDQTHCQADEQSDASPFSAGERSLNERPEDRHSSGEQQIADRVNAAQRGRDGKAPLHSLALLGTGTAVDLRQRRLDRLDCLQHWCCRLLEQMVSRGGGFNDAGDELTIAHPPLAGGHRQLALLLEVRIGIDLEDVGFASLLGDPKIDSRVVAKLHRPKGEQRSSLNSHPQVERDVLGHHQARGAFRLRPKFDLAIRDPRLVGLPVSEVQLYERQNLRPVCVSQYADVNLPPLDVILSQSLVLELLADLADPLGQLVPVVNDRALPDSQRGIRLGWFDDQRKSQRAMGLERLSVEGGEVGRLHLVVLQELLGEDFVLRQQKAGGA